MFPYRAKYTESESDNQNNDLLYTLDQQIQKHFRLFGNIKNEKHETQALFCKVYKLHYYVFVFLCNRCKFCNFLFLYLYILHV